MEKLRLKPDAGTMANLLLAVTNTSNNVSYDEQCMLIIQFLVKWLIYI